MTFKFTVISAFCLRGERVEPGTVFESDDPALIGDLLGCRRILPADDRTAAHVRQGGPQWGALADPELQRDRSWIRDGVRRG